MSASSSTIRRRFPAYLIAACCCCSKTINLLLVDLISRKSQSNYNPVPGQQSTKVGMGPLRGGQRRANWPLKFSVQFMLFAGASAFAATLKVDALNF